MICAVVITVLFMNGSSLGLVSVEDKDSENYTGSDYFTENDLRGDWDMSSYSTKITLKKDSAKISGNGAYSYDGNVYITKSGFYELKGELSDGSIIVDAKSNAKVWLRLCGVDINCSDDAAIIVDQADKVFLTLADGSENTF